MTDIENQIKELIKKYQIHTNYNDYTEIFQVNNNISLEKIMSKIDNIVNINNNPSIEDIKTESLITTISTLESDNNYHKQNKLLELKNIGLIEKTKQDQEKTKQDQEKTKQEQEKTRQIELNAYIKIDQEKTKQEYEKTKQEQEKTKQLELQIELFKLTNKIN